jgi:hypothetical protein
MLWKSDKLHSWLSNAVTQSQDKRYRHRLLKEELSRRSEILEELKSLIWQAHDDARCHFRGFLANSLDLITGSPTYDLARGYPECLPLTTLKGYFGEIFAGLMAENFSPFEIDEWKVPAFLFRFHNTAYDQLERIRDTGEEAKAIFGRTGNDCLAFQLDSSGHIRRSLICEAKCTANHDAKMIALAHEQISDLGSRPVSTRQIVEILKDRLQNEGTDQNVLDWIIALEGLRLGDTHPEYERCDLVTYICGQSPKQENRLSWNSLNRPHEKYTAGRPLEVVEIHLHEVDALIKEFYGTPDRGNEKAKQVVEMREANPRLVDLARGLREELAGSFPPRFAKLYSQHSRLRAHQAGLHAWREGESQDRLDDAVRLLEAAFIEREAHASNDWRHGVRRAGELLEWLAHPELNPDKLPIRLLAAAAYQLACYPARASGLLNVTSTEDSESKILLALLKADFRSLLRELTNYWSGNMSPTAQTVSALPWPDTASPFDNFHQLVVTETAKALGVLCAAMRWGEEDRLEKALEKLSTISKMMLHGNDFYGWLLARLCAEVASTYAKTSMKFHLAEFSSAVNPRGQRAIENYIRLGYQDGRCLVWPSQILGIRQLTLKAPFALCTPTGSGKTTVAELAILQSLFSEQIVNPDEQLLFPDGIVPFAIYLVPSRALAAEVEDKLSRALRRLKAEIIVTSLYGGTDWGPTDAWLTEETPTVLICTYEKAEALMRFLGPLFRNRISLVVIDEAHFVEFDGNWKSLREAENRTLRLESLGTRLLTHLDKNKGRAIALSAVASEMENTLASWITGHVDAVSEKSLYRSTRQLIGRLECLPNNRFEIHYDLLDGANLKFETGPKTTPFIPNPFPPHPLVLKWDRPEIRPDLFWAAMQLAKPDEQGQQRTVLISITQYIGGYAKDFLTLLESTWREEDIPNFFQRPVEGSAKWEIWNNCLKSCEDYFTARSHEYRLLKKGVIIHHGKMPGLMARLLVELIQEKIIYVVLATSTLSDGVNLPFETILIPSLSRYGKLINMREFNNLIGRSGRPGFGTEGRSLVLLNPESRERTHYHQLIRVLRVQNQAENEQLGSTKSPLAELLIHLEKQWREISGSEEKSEFLGWLEKTAPIEFNGEFIDQVHLIETLDSLDTVLLSAIVEMEQIAQDELSPDDLEDNLRQLWQRSYARYAHEDQARLENLFTQRGRALKEQIYRKATDRKKLYRTGLPPRSGSQLLKIYPAVIEHLKTGMDYTEWNENRRFDYITTIIQQLSVLPKFSLEEHKGGWENVLRWWFDLFFRPISPSIDQISDWHDYVSKNFGYRSNWGLGCVVSLAMEETYGDALPSLEDWPQTGLPWVVFWLKELIVWGTLEPVAAYLLSRRIEITRADAKERAKKYYDGQPDDKTPDELLNAVTIRRWAEELSKHDQTSSPLEPPQPIQVDLLRDFTNTAQSKWRVVPVETNDKLYWFDPAGSPLASCHKFEGWQPSYLDTHDFVLDASKETVSSQLYI